MAQFVTILCASKGETTVETTNKETGEVKKVSKPLYLVTTICDKKFWTNEPISAGTAVVLTERKKGEKYERDGQEFTVKTDGWNFEGVIGKAEQINSITETKKALVMLHSAGQ